MALNQDEALDDVIWCTLNRFELKENWQLHCSDIQRKKIRIYFWNKQEPSRNINRKEKCTWVGFSYSLRNYIFIPAESFPHKLRSSKIQCAHYVTCHIRRCLMSFCHKSIFKRSRSEDVHLRQEMGNILRCTYCHRSAPPPPPPQLFSSSSPRLA